MLIIGPMRIGMYHGRLPEPGRKPAGVEALVDRLSAALVRRGHEVTVFTYSEDSVPRPYGVRTIRPTSAHASKVVKKYLAAWLFNVLYISAFDVFHFHGDDLVLLPAHDADRAHVLRLGAPWRRSRPDRGGVVSTSRSCPAWELLASHLATVHYAIGSDSRAITPRHLTRRRPRARQAATDDPLHRVHRQTRSGASVARCFTRSSRARSCLEFRGLEPRPRASDHCEPGPNVLWLRHPSDLEITDLSLSAWCSACQADTRGWVFRIWRRWHAERL